MKLRWYLGVLVLVGVLPLVVLTAIVTISLARQQQAAFDRGLGDTVTALVTALDNDLQTSLKSLQSLATSPLLDHRDLKGFYEHAGRVLELHRWTTIGLIDSTGEHRLNRARPLGQPLPDVHDRVYFTEVMATGRPYVSDLLKGRATATVDIAIAVPVFRDGQVKSVLFAGVDPGSFNEVFTAQRLPPNAVASIVSRDGLFIARSQDHERYLGQAPVEDYVSR